MILGELSRENSACSHFIVDCEQEKAGEGL